ncbi:hypothetical protein HDV02_001547 [Globomyces sp. JEL0801]|nr:hypothetical protein HDV02_001547 [Globomyces sp. JEL0801]
MKSLIQSKNPKLIQKALESNYSAWGAPSLTLEEYFERESYLASSKFSKESLISWFLVDSDSPEDILSSCETYRIPCLLSTNDGIVKGFCFAIGSVYTPTQHRRKGYASEMMKLLQNTLKSFKDSVASTLYSDIGRDFYANLGWKVHPSKSLVLDQLNTIPSFEVSSIIPLTVDTARKLIEDEESQFLNQFKSLDKPRFAIIPTINELEWLFNRGLFYSRVGKYKRKDQIKSIGIATSTNDGYLTWSHSFKEGILYITMIQCTSANAKMLLLSAITEALKFGLEKVEIWNPSEDLVNAASSISKHFHVIDRTDSLSSLAVWGQEDSELEWVRNEKYAWV